MLLNNNKRSELLCAATLMILKRITQSERDWTKKREYTTSFNLYKLHKIQIYL